MPSMMLVFFFQICFIYFHDYSFTINNLVMILNRFSILPLNNLKKLLQYFYQLHVLWLTLFKLFLFNHKLPNNKILLLLKFESSNIVSFLIVIDFWQFCDGHFNLELFDSTFIIHLHFWHFLLALKRLFEWDTLSKYFLKKNHLTHRS